jgi:hypothetical protein
MPREGKSTAPKTTVTEKAYHSIKRGILLGNHQRRVRFSRKWRSAGSSASAGHPFVKLAIACTTNSFLEGGSTSRIFCLGRQFPDRARPF